MTGLEAALALVDVLNGLEIPYMLVGSFASTQYGTVRSTEDADFVLELGDHEVGTVAARLGPAFRLDPQMGFELFTGTKRYELKVIESLFRIEVFLLSADAHDQERFRRRRHIAMMGRQVAFLSPEDVVVTKLRWGRNKDLDDVHDVIAAQGDLLDWTYIERWCAIHGTTAELEVIRARLNTA